MNFDPMRIVHLTNTILAGGTETYVKRMAIAQAQAGHAVAVLVFFKPESDPTEAVRGLREAGVEVFFAQANSGRDLAGALRARAFLLRFRPHVVHGSSTPLGLALVLAGTGIAAVRTVHVFTEPQVESKARILSWMNRVVVQGVIAVSRAQLEVERDRLGQHPDAEWRVVYNAVDTVAFSPGSSPMTRAGRYVFTMTCRMTPDKGVDDAIRMLDILHREQPDTAFELELMGDGPEVPGLKTLADSLGLSGAVHFRGQVADVRPYLARSDLHLVLSQKETFCYSALEAMACGVPVASYPVQGGFFEVHIPGRTGIAVNVRSPSALAEAVRVFLFDEARRVAAGREARVWAERFSQAASLRETKSFYQHILQPAP